MLAETGIVTAADARRIRDALDRVSPDEVRDVRFDGTCGDLFRLRAVYSRPPISSPQRCRRPRSMPRGSRHARGTAARTMTELADTLVREHEVLFKTAHQATARVLAVRPQHPDAPLADSLSAVCFELLGRPIRYTEERLREILSPRYFVAIRRTPGGPAPEETGRACGQSRAVLAADRQWLGGRRDALAAAQRDLPDRSAAL